MKATGIVRRIDDLGRVVIPKERRGRDCSAGGPRKGRSPKLDKQVEEDLIAENQRLRMEIEY